MHFIIQRQRFVTRILIRTWLNRSFISNHFIETNRVSQPLFHQRFVQTFNDQEKPLTASDYASGSSHQTEHERVGVSFFIRVPPVGDNVHDITLMRTTRNEGEFIEEDDIIAIIKADEREIEIKSPEAAFLKRCFFKEGQKIRIGDPLFEMAYATKGDIPGSSPFPAPEKPVEQVRATMTEAKEDPKANKYVVENYGGTRNTVWGAASAAVILGVTLYYFMSQREKKKKESNT
jgi:biotin carboxyl carrier protein